jgi:hypothetical protein
LYVKRELTATSGQYLEFVSSKIIDLTVLKAPNRCTSGTDKCSHRHQAKPDVQVELGDRVAQKCLIWQVKEKFEVGARG